MSVPTKGIHCTRCGAAISPADQFCGECGAARPAGPSRAPASPFTPAADSGARVFISYRRDDSAYVASAIHDRLEEKLGADTVFMDVDNVPLGVDFRGQIDQAVSRCQVLVAVVGERWAGLDPATGKRRIDQPQDFVRLEIEIALAKGIPVVPVLVGSAAMPGEHELPESLRGFAYRNAAEVRPGRHLHDQLQRLVEGLLALLKVDAKPSVREQPASQQAAQSPFAHRSVPVQDAANRRRWNLLIDSLLLIIPSLVSMVGVVYVNRYSSAPTPTFNMSLGILVWAVSYSLLVALIRRGMLVSYLSCFLPALAGQMTVAVWFLFAWLDTPGYPTVQKFFFEYSPLAIFTSAAFALPALGLAWVVARLTRPRTA